MTQQETIQLAIDIIISSGLIGLAIGFFLVFFGRRK